MKHTVFYILYCHNIYWDIYSKDSTELNNYSFVKSIRNQQQRTGQCRVQEALFSNEHAPHVQKTDLIFIGRVHETYLDYRLIIGGAH